MSYFDDSLRAFAGATIWETLAIFAAAAWLAVMVVSVVVGELPPESP